jgi:hypothetical protein
MGDLGGRTSERRERGVGSQKKRETKQKWREIFKEMAENLPILAGKGQIFLYDWLVTHKFNSRLRF